MGMKTIYNYRRFSKRSIYIPFIKRLMTTLGKMLQMNITMSPKNIRMVTLIGVKGQLRYVLGCSPIKIFFYV